MRAVARKRRRDDSDHDVMLAWQIERMRIEVSNTKKLPDLKTLLGRGKRTKAQSVEEQRAALQVLAEQYGLTVRKRRKTKKR